MQRELINLSRLSIYEKLSVRLLISANLDSYDLRLSENLIINCLTEI